jgi:hypothetical protein
MPGGAEARPDTRDELDCGREGRSLLRRALDDCALRAQRSPCSRAADRATRRARDAGDPVHAGRENGGVHLAPPLRRAQRRETLRRT